jgi:hypothetical protein
MARSTSTLDPDNVPLRRGRKPLQGHDTGSLGPSDTSDSGQDMKGPGLTDDVLHLDRGTNEDLETGSTHDPDAGPAVGDLRLDNNSDSRGTGEHLTAGQDPKIREDQDRDVDRVVGANEAGLGGGLDQAEEAQLGITDEQLADEEAEEEPDPVKAPPPKE